MTGLSRRSFRSAALFVVIYGSLGACAFADPLTILDTFPVPTSTVLPTSYAASGIIIANWQRVGPFFTVRDHFVLTRLGAFASPCFGCNGPLQVQILPVLDSGPDLTNVVASFLLSGPDAWLNNPYVYSFQSATMQLPLSSGTYVALFGAEALITWTVMSGARDSSNLAPDPTRLLYVHPPPINTNVFKTSFAVRIEGTTPHPSPVPEPTSFLLAATGIGMLVSRQRCRKTMRRSKPEGG